VYPLPFIDIFSFDWKMPKGTAILERIHIHDWAEGMFAFEFQRFGNVLHGNIENMESIGCFFNVCLAIAAILSPFFIIARYIKGRMDKGRFYLYLLMVGCIVFSLVSAPDFRFVYGYLLGITFLLAFLYKKEKSTENKAKWSSMIFLSIILISFGFVATKKFIEAGERIGVKFETVTDFAALYHHRSPKNLNSFEEYNMNGHIIHITKEKWDNRSFDILPATDPNGIPFELFTGLKIQDIRTVEARGKSLQDGFRTKKEYVDIINNNIEKYKSDYEKYKGQRIYTTP